MKRLIVILMAGYAALSHAQSTSVNVPMLQKLVPGIVSGGQYHTCNYGYGAKAKVYSNAPTQIYCVKDSRFGKAESSYGLSGSRVQVVESLHEVLRLHVGAPPGFTLEAVSLIPTKDPRNSEYAFLRIGYIQRPR